MVGEDERGKAAQKEGSGATLPPTSLSQVVRGGAAAAPTLLGDEAERTMGPFMTLEQLAAVRALDDEASVPPRAGGAPKASAPRHDAAEAERTLNVLGAVPSAAASRGADAGERPRNPATSKAEARRGADAGERTIAPFVTAKQLGREQSPAAANAAPATTPKHPSRWPLMLGGLVVLGAAAFGVTWWLKAPRDTTSSSGPGLVPVNEQDVVSLRSDNHSLTSSESQDASEALPHVAPAPAAPQALTEGQAADDTAERAKVGDRPDVAATAAAGVVEPSEVAPAEAVAAALQRDEALRAAEEAAEAAAREVLEEARVAKEAREAAERAEAVERAEERQTPDPALAQQLNRQGFSARKAGDNARALVLYSQAVAADPLAVWPRYNYACELALLGRRWEAMDSLEVLTTLGSAEARRALNAAYDDEDFKGLRSHPRFLRLLGR